MLNKILITALVIAVVATVTRWRSRRAQQIPVVNVTQVPAAAPLPRWVRPAAYGFAAVIALGSAIWYYSAWRDGQQIVIIRVISTSSGEVATYRARKGSIDGRMFVTTDGFEVRVADADRVEVQRAE
ncbi:MAG: antitermination protein NusG [Pseudomonadota bacterium]